MKKVLVLGCTGSIGTSALDVARASGGSLQVCGLVARSSREKIERLAREFSCPFSLFDDDKDCVAKMIDRTKPDIAVNGISGSDGLLPSKAVVERGVDLALANKETVVMAWPLVKALSEKSGANIIPVDSEHSAIFDLIQKAGRENVVELILTASGGPFRKFSKEELSRVTVEQALSHPTWKMGAKITVDSATLANKGLEVIEACRLFDFAPENVSVVAHPQSVVHSLVRAKDGMVYAQLSEPDMRHPISRALFWPLLPRAFSAPFDLAGMSLEFEKPRMDTFPMLGLAYGAAKAGGLCAVAYNAANEVAARAFLAGEISFSRIHEIVDGTLSRGWSGEPGGFDEVFAVDREAREIARSFLAKCR